MTKGMDADIDEEAIHCSNAVAWMRYLYSVNQ
jgi:hypothetical protein